MPARQTSFLFDLDGTLVDSVYQHVLAWHEALAGGGHRALDLAHPPPDRHERRPVHQHAAARDRHRHRRRTASSGCRQLHAEAYNRRVGDVRPLPGARELLAYLTEAGIPWAIATSGRMETAGPVLEAARRRPERVPVVTRDKVRYAKPDPDSFLAAAERARTSRSKAPASSATASGTCWPRAAPRRSASAFSRAAMARRNWCGPAPTASTTTPPTS